MTTVNGTSNAKTPEVGNASANAAKSIQDQFLKLLVTQLKNQDPLNPMQNAELTSQLAQISTVEGITNLNKTLLSISGQIDVSQSMNAAALIGKAVLVPGDKVSLGTDVNDPTHRVATPVGYDVPSDAAKLTLKIMDAAGNVLRTVEVQDVKTGVYTYDWDGNTDDGAPVKDGAYVAKVTAYDADNKEVKAEILSYGLVKGVDYTTDGVRLDLGITGGKVSLLDIRKILNG
ncbi:flagellar hook assembly protein FlgD [Bordetella avium]|uniref:Basal-body rod modification protein FlgD n=1 Tax=Bordetella avium (strain 197N) TaxID=360910 RepID=Q2L1B7_BORA1|nr:flagellar hook capping FlgD N-terminal domain-containing protein [Bordetella avium]AZY49069.1 flagellar basal body rod modification protein [Bordetella avium]AZY52427.1 flagellar basal body rod modification protein [Bordetella avium]RIQ11524.1 flagellar basal body rod modification protein [Bordetella avium]RIQ15929.1 flagellar basal body rod modification protein [Bordetella avium]RIQ30149.1 flagellar basal body rod modification protein [Bordetella avium]